MLLFLLIVTIQIASSVSNQLCYPENPCLNRGHCQTVGANGFNCTCQKHYSGNLCQFFRICERVPCLKTGECIPDNSPEGYQCHCKDGYYGNNCKKSACDINPCKNGGVCFPDSSMMGYRCKCPRYYIDETSCEVSICSLIKNPCSNNGECVPTSYETYRCKCNGNYSGLFCDIQNACHGQVCSGHGSCQPINTRVRGFQCQCAGNYSGDNCEKSACSPQNPCQNGGQCNLTSASPGFKCSCPSVGFSGYRCEIRGCFNQCQNGGECLRTFDRAQQSYRCNCKGGYYGKFCEVKKQCFCKNGGTCQWTYSGYFPRFKRCMCINFTSGRLCEKSVACLRRPCKNGGLCIPDSSIDRFNCKCEPGTNGTRCEETACSPQNPCQNGGQCIVTSASPWFKCSCPIGFSGNKCETVV